MVQQTSPLPIIGRNTIVDLVGYADQIPAKIDTGADSSAVWASNVRVAKNGTLHFTLFGKDSPHYTGEVIKRRQYTVSMVRSSSGHEQIRYRVQLPVRVRGKRIKASFNLSDRSNNDFPILLGRRTLNKKFLVDVSHLEHQLPAKDKSAQLREEFALSPHEFYKKYHGNAPGANKTGAAK